LCVRSMAEKLDSESVSKLSVKELKSLVQRAGGISLVGCNEKSVLIEKAKDAIGIINRRNSYKLVQRLLHKASHVLNVELRPFMMQNLSVFEQDEAERERCGETLAQYKVFMQYEEKLAKHLDDFAEDEGFEDTKDCFKAIENAVNLDKVLTDKHMQTMLETVKQLELEHFNEQRADASAIMAATNSTSVDDVDFDVDSLLEEVIGSSDSSLKKKKAEQVPDSACTMPLVLLFQPLSLEHMVKSLLNMADYQTFSFMMRRKAQHMKSMRKAEADMRQIVADSKKRKLMLMDEGCDSAVLSACFAKLTTRLCGLVPHRTELNEKIRLELDQALFDDFLRDESLLAYTMSLKKLLRFLFGHISNLCSPTHRPTVKMHGAQLETMMRSDDTSATAFARKLLLHAHSDTDRIQIEAYAFLKTYQSLH